MQTQFTTTLKNDDFVVNDCWPAGQGW